VKYLYRPETWDIDVEILSTLYKTMFNVNLNMDECLEIDYSNLKLGKLVSNGGLTRVFDFSDGGDNLMLYLDNYIDVYDLIIIRLNDPGNLPDLSKAMKEFKIKNNIDLDVNFIEIRKIDEGVWFRRSAICENSGGNIEIENTYHPECTCRISFFIWACLVYSRIPINVIRPTDDRTDMTKFYIVDRYTHEMHFGSISHLPTIMHKINDN
jgi:hypothetical protein